MSLAAILALVNSIVSAAATMAKSMIELVPWSNPIVWVLLSFVGGCEYGRHSIVQQVNEQRRNDERPVINHPFRPWIGVSEAEGDEIQPNYEFEDVQDVQDEIPAEPPVIEAKPVSESLPAAACGPQGSGPRAVRPVRNLLRRIFRR